MKEVRDYENRAQKHAHYIKMIISFFKFFIYGKNTDLTCL